MWASLSQPTKALSEKERLCSLCLTQNRNIHLPSLGLYWTLAVPLALLDVWLADSLPPSPCKPICYSKPLFDSFSHWFCLSGEARLAQVRRSGQNWISCLLDGLINFLPLTILINFLLRTIQRYRLMKGFCNITIACSLLLLLFAMLCSLVTLVYRLGCFHEWPPAWLSVAIFDHSCCPREAPLRGGLAERGAYVRGAEEAGRSHVCQFNVL